MVMLVSYEQACDQLRIDTDDDQNDVNFTIEASSEAILNHLNSPDSYFDSAGDVVLDNVPAVVKKAVLCLVSILYDDREGAQWSAEKLPPAVIALLTPLRDPTMA
jgi:hypothetical protein